VNTSVNSEFPGVVATQTVVLPTLTVSQRAAQRLRQGLPLVSRSEIVAPPQGMGDVAIALDPRGQRLGSVLWCAQGPIAARFWSSQCQPLDESLLHERILAADRRRRALYDDAKPTRDAYRVVHGEADQLPGLFVDRYADAAVIQTATQAMEARKPLLVKVLQDVLGVRTVVIRDDGSARDLEQLPRSKFVALGGPQAMVRFHDAGSQMAADLLLDRKTGSFLDQQENHALAADYARRLAPLGRGLDCFTYHGGFALALAQAGLTVMACDEDPQAILRARENAALTGCRVDFRVHNAFDLLRSLEAAGEKFDVVVVDPPALAKRGPRDAGSHQAAMRAYKELNLRSLRLLRAGGVLVSCSCSGRVSALEFGLMLEAAALDVGRPVQILERRGAGRDHPVLCGMPETEYLKCWVLQVLT
jgi:23S rRNA (cytosine1962-C5)-methyltransferase